MYFRRGVPEIYFMHSIRSLRAITINLSFRFDYGVDHVDVKLLVGPDGRMGPVWMPAERGLGAGSDVRDAGSGVRAGSIWRWGAVASHG